jgi:hypothetical protein
MIKIIVIIMPMRDSTGWKGALLLLAQGRGARAGMRGEYDDA